jgi:hypothetical protein
MPIKELLKRNNHIVKKQYIHYCTTIYRGLPSRRRLTPAAAHFTINSFKK